jgi:predicted DNA-binding transcriptional regulator AlpA
MEDHPTDQTPNAPATTEPAELELWDCATVLKFFGGSKPIHISTLYRGISNKFYPPPMNVSPNVVRWLGHECREAQQRQLAARDHPKKLQGAARRGRKRRNATKAASATEAAQ